MPAQRSVKFLMSMFVAFFALMEPASCDEWEITLLVQQTSHKYSCCTRKANPACISKMREPMATRKKSSFQLEANAYSKIVDFSQFQNLQRCNLNKFKRRKLALRQYVVHHVGAECCHSVGEVHDTLAKILLVGSHIITQVHFSRTK